MAAISVAIAERVADNDQASRAACEWSKGGGSKVRLRRTADSICRKRSVTERTTQANILTYFIFIKNFKMLAQPAVTRRLAKTRQAMDMIVL